jgi:WD40 repeat protein
LYPAHMIRLFVFGTLRLASDDHSQGTIAPFIPPDGNYIASASWDETIRIWDPQTGVSRTLTRHTAGLSCLAFSSDSKCLVSGSWDGSVIVWDVTSGGIISGPSPGRSEVVIRKGC